MAGPIRIAILANGRQARSEINQTSGALGRLGKFAKSGLATAGVVGLAAGVVGVGKAAISAEATYSTSMRLIQASTKASQSQMSQLNDLAIKLGAETSFSAQEAADAMLELAKAGLDTKTIMSGGLSGTLQLAAAGGTDLGTAATIASNALNTFNLRGSDMVSVAAALAGGANASSASVESLGQALQQVGPGATNAGLSIQETVAALSAFDAAGIKGSDAGTSLKTMLTRLVPTTAKAASEMDRLGLKFTDANGEFLSLTQISAELQREFRGLSAAERTKALATVFGSDATRAATVLMKEGAAGVRDYIKATSDQTAAQKMAEARMGGTAGALERLSGAAETAKLRIGQELAPATTAVADALADNLGPALEGSIGLVKDVASAVQPAASLLKSLAGLGRDAAGVLGSVPGPVRELAIQAGLAALVLPRLSSAVGTVATSMRNATTYARVLNLELRDSAGRSALAGQAMARLGGAARTAAGVGGLLLLANASKSTSREMQAFSGIAGSTLAGFSVGGPWGAAIGFGVSSLYELHKAFTDTSAVAQAARTGIGDYRDTLDQATGAVTRQTRELILLQAQQNGVAGLATRLGINQRDLIGAVQGNAGATKRLSAAYRENFDLLNGSEQVDFNQWLRDNTNELADQRAETKANAQATQTWKQALSGIPKEARTDIKAIGTDISAAQVRKLRREYDLTPKQVRTIIQALGTETTVRKIRGVYQVLDASGKIKADLGPFERSFLAGMNRVRDDAQRGGTAASKSLRDTTSKARPNLGPFAAMLGQNLRRFRTDSSLGGLAMSRGLEDGTAKARANLSSFQSSLRGGIDSARGTASSGGHGIGAALGQGVSSGISAYVGSAVAAAANLVSQAIAAARARAQARSPSRQTMRLGRDMGEGLTVGLRQKTKQNKKAAGDLVRAFLKAARESDRALGREVRRRLDKKLSGDALKRAAKATQNETRALARNAAAQDRVNQKLEDARQRLKDLTQASRQYAESVRTSALSYASVTSLDSAFNPGAIAAAMQARLDKLRQFQSLLSQLKQQGLNQTTLDQLVQGGVEGGLAYADAIAQGGAGAVAEINDLQKQIGGVAGQLGQLGANNMYAAGIKAAEGLVKGLRSRERELDRIASRMARRLAKVVRRQLGIKSPSRVFEKLGQQTAEGLRIGIDDPKVRRAGEVLARDLVSGFARPQLSAQASLDPSSRGLAGMPVFRIEVQLTAQQLSAAQRGKAIQIDLDAYRDSGGRPTVRQR